MYRYCRASSTRRGEQTPDSSILYTSTPTTSSSCITELPSCSIAHRIRSCIQEVLWNSDSQEFLLFIYAELTPDFFTSSIFNSRPVDMPYFPTSIQKSFFIIDKLMMSCMIDSVGAYSTFFLNPSRIPPTTAIVYLLSFLFGSEFRLVIEHNIFRFESELDDIGIRLF